MKSLKNFILENKDNQCYEKIVTFNYKDANSLIEKAKKENKKIFLYLLPIDDHSHKVNKDLIVKVDPNILKITDKEIKFDEKTVDKTYINKNVINEIPEKYVTHWNDVDFYNWFFHIYILSDEQIQDL